MRNNEKTLVTEYLAAQNYQGIVELGKKNNARVLRLSLIHI